VIEHPADALTIEQVGRIRTGIFAQQAARESLLSAQRAYWRYEAIAYARAYTDQFGDDMDEVETLLIRGEPR
jgi:hypothetical protein